MPPDAKQKYQAHKSNAAQRGIQFDLTFDEWWAIWEQHFHNRGRASDQMQMCRDRDEGGYRTGNVRIDTARNNNREAQITKTRRTVISEVPEAASVREAQQWVFRRDIWGWDYFKRREYMEEHPSQFGDEEID